MRNPPDRFIHLAAQKENTSQQFAAEEIFEGVRFLIAALVADDGNPMTRSFDDGFPEQGVLVSTLAVAKVGFVGVKAEAGNKKLAKCLMGDL